MNAMAIKLNERGAIAFGNLKMCVSGVYGSQRSPATAESFACRLADDWSFLQPRHIFVGYNGQTWSRRLQPLGDVLDCFCKENGVTLIKVATARFQSRVAGHPSTKNELFALLKNAGPRSIHEADVMALLEFGCSYLADLAAAGGLKQ
ncbi:hypothetical protein LJR030_000813 [Rhizobium sp. LjRoot30]|uniref:hypothetical protein n=1 Tax=Rhizobium sp. LjRoot30 TaxID=3342320 RepID=UPI003ECCF135